MLAEIVQTTTADGLSLHGALHQRKERDGSVSQQRSVDAVLVLHGVGGNFYNSVLLSAVTQHLVDSGITVLQANTRGHDFVSIIHTSLGPRRYGAAYESVDECRHDIDAWLDLLAARGEHRLILLGHSLGAIKALYRAARQPPLAVRGIVAISPPCLSFSRFATGPRAALFSRYMARAQEHIDAKMPHTLLRVRYPFPLLITAAGYINKYGPAEHYNILRFAHQVPCPTLFIYGRCELDSGSLAFENLPQALNESHRGSTFPRHHIIVPGADHVYSGCEAQVAHDVGHWLAGI